MIFLLKVYEEYKNNSCFSYVVLVGMAAGAEEQKLVYFTAAKKRSFDWKNYYC